MYELYSKDEITELGIDEDKARKLELMAKYIVEWLQNFVDRIENRVPITEHEK